MTFMNQFSPSSMSNEPLTLQEIERLAVEVMGWHEEVPRTIVMKHTGKTRYISENGRLEDGYLGDRHASSIEKLGLQWLDQKGDFVAWKVPPERCWFSKSWDPSTDWNHAHELLDKIMEDESLCKMFLSKFFFDNERHAKGVARYIRADQPKLMRAILSILPTKS